MTRRRSPADFADAAVLQAARALESGAAEPTMQRRAARMLRGMLAQLRAAEAASSRRAPPCAIRTIQELTADEYGLTVAELIGERRAARFAHARAMAIHLAREMTQRTWGDIARMFNRDHTTCMHAHSVTISRLAMDHGARSRMEAIVERIYARRQAEQLPMAAE